MLKPILEESNEKTSNNELNLTTGKLQIKLIPGTWVRNAVDTNKDGKADDGDGAGYNAAAGLLARAGSGADQGGAV